MKTNRFFTFIMAMVVMTTLLLPAGASEVVPRDSRFRYYTVTDPNWTYSSRLTITADQSNQFQTVQDKIWNALSNAAGGDITNASEIIDEISNYVRQNNLDFSDAGTYTIYYKNKISYKEHLLTGEVTVELKQRIMKVDFFSAEKTNSRQMTLTLR